MNYIDVGIIAIILFFAVAAYRKGLIMACFGFLPMCISLAATYKIHPMFSRFLRTTPMYQSLKNGIYQSLQLDTLIEQQALQTQNDLINQMNIPEFLKGTLIENNNPVIYKVLNVSALQDYISGFIANVCINILSMVIIFIIVTIAAKLILKTLDFVSRLPVVSFFNQAGGLAVGLVQGAVFIWIIGIALTFFYYDPKFQPFFTMLNQSKIGMPFYENNLLLFMILKIFA